MTQENLFIGGPFMSVEMKPRLSRQCRLMLELLQKGPATNVQFASIALSYTRRISDLRQAGYSVKIVSHDYVTGITVYELEK